MEHVHLVTVGWHHVETLKTHAGRVLGLTPDLFVRILDSEAQHEIPHMLINFSLLGSYFTRIFYFKMSSKSKSTHIPLFLLLLIN